MSDDRALVLAEHYLDVDRPADALRALAERNAPPDERTWIARSDALRRLDRHEEGREAAWNGLAALPDSTVLLELLCLCEQELGDVAAAERAVREALALDPGSAHMTCRYGHLLARAGRLEEAALMAGRAEELDPGGADPRRLRMAIAYVAGGGGAAAREGHDLLALEPEDAGAHRSLAIDAAARGDLATAVRHMEEVVRADPADEEAAEVARHFRAEAHPALVPLWPFRRFGPWKVLAAAWILIAIGGAISPVLGGLLIFAYAALVLYGWIVPSLLRAGQRRRSR